MRTPKDPDVLAFIARTEACYPADANTASAAENRRIYDAMCSQFRVPRPAEIAVRDSVVEASDPVRTVPIRTYDRPGAGAPATVLYAHGGGYVVGGLESHDDVCAELCAKTGCTVVAVDYRLAPEHRYPAQLDDVAAVFLHLVQGGARVVAVGDSAGGGLSAALAMRMRRHGGPMPAATVLIYPGLGGDMTASSYVENAEAPLLRTADCVHYAGLLTGGRPRTNDPELSPLTAHDFSGLPPSYVVTADIDPLRDDGRDYVHALQAAGIEAHWRNEPELVHGFLRARHGSRRAGASFEAICAAIRRFCH